MDDLISRNALLAGIEELKESPWFNFGKADPNKIRHEWMEGMIANEESMNNIKYGKRADYVHYDYDTIEEATEE